MQDPELKLRTLLIRGQGSWAETSLHHSHAGKCRGQHGSAPTARCVLLPWQTSQGPKKIDDKYNNTRCNHAGQLPAMCCLPLSQGPIFFKSEKKQSQCTLREKLLSNVVIFSPCLQKSGNLEGHALETLHEPPLRDSSPLPLRDIYFPVLCTGCPADGIQHPL